jgi:hypothetical protein
VQLPAWVRSSHAVLPIEPHQPNDPLAEASAFVGHAGTLWTGVPEFAIVAVAEPLQRVAVLELRWESPELSLHEPWHSACQSV